MVMLFLLSILLLFFLLFLPFFFLFSSSLSKFFPRNSIHPSPGSRPASYPLYVLLLMLSLRLVPSSYALLRLCLLLLMLLWPLVMTTVSLLSLDRAAGAKMEDSMVESDEHA